MCCLVYNPGFSQKVPAFFFCYPYDHCDHLPTWNFPASRNDAVRADYSVTLSKATEQAAKSENTASIQLHRSQRDKPSPSSVSENCGHHVLHKKHQFSHFMVKCRREQQKQPKCVGGHFMAHLVHLVHLRHTQM